MESQKNKNHSRMKIIVYLEELFNCHVGLGLTHHITEVGNHILEVYVGEFTVMNFVTSY